MNDYELLSMIINDCEWLFMGVSFQMEVAPLVAPKLYDQNHGMISMIQWPGWLVHWAAIP